MATSFKIFSAVLLITKCLNSAAQESQPIILWTLYPGYIIKNEGDTVYGELLLKNKISNQGKVFFFDSGKTEEPSAKYKPGEIKAYKVADRFYETVKYSPEYTTMRYCFLLRIIDGPIKLYQAYYDDKKRIQINVDEIWKSKIDLSFSEAELKEQILGCRAGGEIQDFGSLAYLMKFKKTMSEYLSDYPEIANKIANKEKGYQWGDLEKIIDEYNQWYLSQRKK